MLFPTLTYQKTNQMHSARKFAEAEQTNAAVENERIAFLRLMNPQSSDENTLIKDEETSSREGHGRLPEIPPEAASNSVSESTRFETSNAISETSHEKAEKIERIIRTIATHLLRVEQSNTGEQVIRISLDASSSSQILEINVSRGIAGYQVQLQTPDSALRNDLQKSLPGLEARLHGTTRSHFQISVPGTATIKQPLGGLTSDKRTTHFKDEKPCTTANAKPCI